MSGLKYDGDKVPVHQGLNKYFPRALKAVAAISKFGFDKYKAWGGWKTVEDGEERYENAIARHTLDRMIDGPVDPESHMLHRAHRAWNALATLELELLAAEHPIEKLVERACVEIPRWGPFAHASTKSQQEAGERYDNAGGEDQAQGERSP